jgi:curli production assembly/transport component CsgE
MAGKTPYSQSRAARRRASALLRQNAIIAFALFGVGLTTTIPAQSAPGSPAARGSTEESSGYPAADRGEEARRAVERMFDDPMTGVVVNRTVTVQGKDFYKDFSSRWVQNPEAAKFTISVHERPSARFGSEIWVQYRQQRMFHIFLPAARSRTRQISAEATEIVLRNITRREAENRMVTNPDMGPEEL